jgi:hypothetical protein
VTSDALAGHWSVDASAKRIRHYRYVEERIMRMLGGWIALTPELSAKLLFGRHVWDCAQHADLWGKRLPELRALAQQSEPPADDVVALIDSLESREAFHETPERLAGVYRVLKPCLLGAYERHLAEANPVYEPPTRRILQRCIDEERRHIAAASVVLGHLSSAPGVEARVADWVSRSLARLAGTPGIVGDGITALAQSPVPEQMPHVAQDLVHLEKPAERWPIPEDLARAVDAHARAIVSGDFATLAEQVVPEARAAALETYRGVARLGALEATLVACARLGGQWQIKQRLAHAGGVEVIQTRWTRPAESWQVAEVDVVRREGPSHA